MKKHATRNRLAALVIAALSSAAWAAEPGQPSTAQARAPISQAVAANMASNCFACHGPDGKSTSAIPSLHMLPAVAIIANLKGFKSGERPATVMNRHAKGYTDDEIEALAIYIATINKN